MIIKTKPVRMAIAALAICCLTSLLAPAAQAATQETSAAACVGTNGRTNVHFDPRTGVESADVNLDSCVAAEMIKGFDRVKTEADYVERILADVPLVPRLAALVSRWAWGNKTALQDAAKPGQGVFYRDIGGIISGCKSQ